MNTKPIPSSAAHQIRAHVMNLKHGLSFAADYSVTAPSLNTALDLVREDAGRRGYFVTQAEPYSRLGCGMPFGELDGIGARSIGA